METKVCSVEGCESPVKARGWCHKHYMRWYTTGDPLGLRRTVPGECKERGCGRITVGQGWCDTHYARYVRVPKRKAARLASKQGRTCSWCGTPIDPSRRSSAEFCSRECKNAEFIASGKAREVSLRSYYRRQYGLTLEAVEQMRERGCDICGAENGGGRHGQLHVDHCHATGRVRGILCDSCNTGLGKFKDDPDRLRAAAEYLTR